MKITQQSITIELADDLAVQYNIDMTLLKQVANDVQDELEKRIMESIYGVPSQHRENMPEGRLRIFGKRRAE